MKKKMLLVSATLTIFIMSWVVSPAVVTAADAFYSNCTIELVGAGADAYSGYVVVQLTCPGFFTNKNFNIPTTNVGGANRALATILTAMSLEKTVMIYVADTSPATPNVTVAYLYK